MMGRYAVVVVIAIVVIVVVVICANVRNDVGRPTSPSVVPKGDQSPKLVEGVDISEKDIQWE